MIKRSSFFSSYGRKKFLVYDGFLKNFVTLCFLLLANKLDFIELVFQVFLVSLIGWHQSGRDRQFATIVKATFHRKSNKSE